MKLLNKLAIAQEIDVNSVQKIKKKIQNVIIKRRKSYHKKPLLIR